MNKDILAILATAALVLATGCVTAGTWVNGYYVDGPLCTVCDGTRIVAHTYGTTVCAHCNGTGIEPPETTMVVENVIVDTWHPLPPHPLRCHHHRPIVRRLPSHHVGGGHRPAPRPVRPVARPARPARPAHPAGGGARRSGGGRGRR